MTTPCKLLVRKLEEKIYLGDSRTDRTLLKWVLKVSEIPEITLGCNRNATAIEIS